MTARTWNNAQGFTLLEILVAIVLLSLSFTMISQLFSGSLRLASLNRSYGEAVTLADQKMGELLQAEEPPEKDGFTDNGIYKDIFAWDVSVVPYEGLTTEDEDAFPLELFKVDVKVSWGEGENQRVISLSSIKSFAKSLRP